MTETTESTSETTEGDETTETETTEEVVPLTAEDITFAEGFEVNEELRDELLAVLNDREKSPKELAQSLSDLHQKASKQFSEAMTKMWEDTQTKWRDEVKADPDIGGDKLQTTIGRIGRLVTEYGTPELAQIFDSTGAGNNVHMIKFLDKMAAKLVEPEAVTGTPTAQRSDAASRLFPSMPN